MAASRVDGGALHRGLDADPGGGIAAYVYATGYAKVPSERIQKLQNARLFTWGRLHVKSVSLKSKRATSRRMRRDQRCKLVSPIVGPRRRRRMNGLLATSRASRSRARRSRPRRRQAKLPSTASTAPITVHATTPTEAARLSWHASKVDHRRYIRRQPLRPNGRTPLLGVQSDLFAFRPRDFQIERDTITDRVERLGFAARLTLTKTTEVEVQSGTAVPADRRSLSRFSPVDRDVEADAFVTDSYVPRTPRSTAWITRDFP